MRRCYSVSVSSNVVELKRGASRTGSHQSLGKVRKIHVYREIRLAGAVKRVRERVTLKSLQDVKSALRSNCSNA